MTKTFDKESVPSGCMQGFITVLMVALLVIVFMLTGCKQVEYVTVTEHHTDTLVQTRVEHDSIHVSDSTVIYTNGDTVFRDRWHTEYRDRWLHDTTYISKTDSVPKPYPVVKEVPAQLTWWQQTRLHIANIALWVLGIGAVVWIIKRRLR